ncbi:MAG: CorA family divalent cation transporter [Clostridia bacterium]|nr:CorA family divalent cation transporter [Clostridia bacterium]
MFYTFRDEAENITLEEARACDFSLGYIGISEFDEVGRLFDLPKNRVETLGYYKYGECICVCLEKVKIFIRHNFVIIVSDNPKQKLPIFHNVLSKLDSGDAGRAKIVYTFIDELLTEEEGIHDEFQKTLAKLEKQILDDRQTENLNRILYCEKQKCISKSNYYSKVQNIVEELKDNDFDLFDEMELKYFDNLSDKIARLRDDVRMIIESIVHLRDAYQSAIDLKLNNTMKLFTVVTVIFAPLGFITGWFGMNFKNMPLVSSPYGVAVAGIVSIAVTVGMIVWLKLKR